MPEKLIEYEGPVKITVELGDGHTLVIEEEKAKFSLDHEWCELPDERCGYVLHKLRREDTYTFRLVTDDNLDLLEERRQREQEETQKIEFVETEYVDLTRDIGDTEPDTCL